MDAVMIGHSFIRRLRDETFPPRVAHRRIPRGQDIHHVQQNKARAFASKLRLDDNIRAIYTASNGINLIKDLHKSESLIFQIRPDMILIDIGSNDLANLTDQDHNSALNFAHQVLEFAESLPAHLIIINAILPRSESITCSPETFRYNASHYNRIVSTFCATSPHIKFNKMWGFNFHYDNDTEQTRPVSLWSLDGIHCDTQIGRKQYRSRIRHALLDNMYIVNRR